MNTKRSLRAMTLFELVVVISIVLVLTLLLFPVLLEARKRSTETACTNNLRQLVVAATLYRDSHDSQWAPSMWSSNAWLRGFVKEKALFTCPLDRAGSGNPNATRFDLIPSSYATWQDDASWRAELLAADQNPGLFVCYQHGVHDGSPGRTYQSIFGTILRARLDGSVERTSAPRTCFVDDSGGAYGGRTYWSLFTNAIPSSSRLDEEVGARGVRIVPCVPAAR
jgi:type II secretory pathway pseudopilin PulG